MDRRSVKMPESKGKAAKTLKDEDIKSISEVVRALLREELEASMQQVANRLDAMQTELTSLTTRIVSTEGELTTMKKDTKKVSTVISNTQISCRVSNARLQTWRTAVGDVTFGSTACRRTRSRTRQCSSWKG